MVGGEGKCPRVGRIGEQEQQRKIELSKAEMKKNRIYDVISYNSFYVKLCYVCP